MLAIGKGAQEEILEQIKMVGVNNIVISPIVEEDMEGDSGEESEEGNRQQSKFSRGLTVLDAESILNILPTVSKISPEVSLNSFVMQSGKRSPAKIIGVTEDYFGMYNLELESGTFFNDYQEEHGIQVCIIGSNIKSKFFSQVDPIGQYLKFGSIWLKVIGVLKKGNFSLTAFENTGVNVYNDNIYIPVKTMLMRFQNRALINTRNASETSVIMGRGFMSVRSSTPSQNTNSNYHQLDKITIQVEETEQLTPTTEVLSRMILRRHSDVKGF